MRQEYVKSTILLASQRLKLYLQLMLMALEIQRTSELPLSSSPFLTDFIFVQCRKYSASLSFKRHINNVNEVFYIKH